MRLKTQSKSAARLKRCSRKPPKPGLRRPRKPHMETRRPNDCWLARMRKKRRNSLKVLPENQITIAQTLVRFGPFIFAIHLREQYRLPESEKFGSNKGVQGGEPMAWRKKWGKPSGGTDCSASRR